MLKIIGIKVCYYLIKIFLHNKIHLKINTVDSHYSELEGTSSKVHCIRRFIITRVDTSNMTTEALKYLLYKFNIIKCNQWKSTITLCMYTHCNILVDMYLDKHVLAVSFMLTCTLPTLSLPKICILCYIRKILHFIHVANQL